MFFKCIRTDEFLLFRFFFLLFFCWFFFLFQEHKRLDVKIWMFLNLSESSLSTLKILLSMGIISNKGPAHTNMWIISIMSENVFYSWAISVQLSTVSSKFFIYEWIYCTDFKDSVEYHYILKFFSQLSHLHLELKTKGVHLVFFGKLWWAFLSPSESQILLRSILH